VDLPDFVGMYQQPQIVNRIRRKRWYVRYACNRLSIIISASNDSKRWQQKKLLNWKNSILYNAREIKIFVIYLKFSKRWNCNFLNERKYL